MNDRYLYRAKRTDNWEWVEGSLITGVFLRLGQDIPYILCPDKADYDCFEDFTEENGIFEVDPSTICQYTGLKDKNGNLIWENDIVRFKHDKFDFDDGLEPFERTCLPNKKEYNRNYVVEFCNTPTHYGLRFRNGSIWFMVHKMTVVMHDTEVIGNIFDNPELLEE